MISLAAFAGKGPKGKLISYSHTQVNPEMPLTSEFSLNWQDGKGILTIYELFLTNENKFTAEVSEEVFRQVTDIIKQKELYAIGKKKRRKAEPVPVSDPGEEVFSIKFEDKSIDCDAKSLKDEQRDALSEIETIIIPTSQEFAHISSSAVRDILKHGGDYSEFIPKGVKL